MTIDLREAGRKGGRISWESLTPEQQKERVRKAGLARIAKLDSAERTALARKAGKAPRKARAIQTAVGVTGEEAGGGNRTVMQHHKIRAL